MPQKKRKQNAVGVKQEKLQWEKGDTLNISKDSKTTSTKSGTNLKSINYYFKQDEIQELKTALKRSNLNTTPLIILAAVLEKIGVIEDLVKQGCDLQEADEDKIGALGWAVKGMKLKSINTLLKLGAEPYIKSEKNHVLTMALETKIWDEESLIKLWRLLESLAQVDVNFVNKNGHTMLHMAVRREWVNLIDILMRENVNVDVTNIIGITPLMLAAYRNNINIVYILLNNEADVEREDDKGFTALCYAISAVRTKNITEPFLVIKALVERLLERNLTLKDYIGKKLHQLIQLNNKINPPFDMSWYIISFMLNEIEDGLQNFFEAKVLELVKEGLVTHLNNADYLKYALMIINEIFKCSETIRNEIREGDVMNIFFGNGCADVCLRIVKKYEKNENYQWLAVISLQFLIVSSFHKKDCNVWLERNYYKLLPTFIRFHGNQLLNSVKVKELKDYAFKISQDKIHRFQERIALLENNGKLHEKGKYRGNRQETVKEKNVKAEITKEEINIGTTIGNLTVTEKLTNQDKHPIKSQETILTNQETHLTNQETNLIDHETFLTRNNEIIVTKKQEPNLTKCQNDKKLSKYQEVKSNAKKTKRRTKALKAEIAKIKSADLTERLNIALKNSNVYTKSRFNSLHASKSEGSCAGNIYDGISCGTSSETLHATSTVTLEATSRETVEAISRETLHSTSRESLKATSRERLEVTSKETLKAILRETLKEASKRTLEEPLKVAPIGALVETSRETWKATSTETLKAIPRETLEATSKKNLKATSRESLQSTTRDTLKENLDTTSREILSTTSKDILLSTSRDIFCSTGREKLHTTSRVISGTASSDTLHKTPTKTLFETSQEPFLTRETLHGSSTQSLHVSSENFHATTGESLNTLRENFNSSGETLNPTLHGNLNTLGENLFTTSDKNVFITSGKNLCITSGENVNISSGENVNTTSDENLCTTLCKHVCTSGKNLNTTLGGNLYKTSGKKLCITSGKKLNTTSGENINTTLGENLHTTSTKQLSADSLQENLNKCFCALFYGTLHSNLSEQCPESSHKAPANFFYETSHKLYGTSHTPCGTSDTPCGSSDALCGTSDTPYETSHKTCGTSLTPFSTSQVTFHKCDTSYNACEIFHKNCETSCKSCETSPEHCETFHKHYETSNTTFHKSYTETFHKPPSEIIHDISCGTVDRYYKTQKIMDKYCGILENTFRKYCESHQETIQNYETPQETFRKYSETCQEAFLKYRETSQETFSKYCETSQGTSYKYCENLQETYQKLSCDTLNETFHIDCEISHETFPKTSQKTFYKPSEPFYKPPPETFYKPSPETFNKPSLETLYKTTIETSCETSYETSHKLCSKTSHKTFYKPSSTSHNMIHKLPSETSNETSCDNSQETLLSAETFINTCIDEAPTRFYNDLWSKPQLETSDISEIVDAIKMTVLTNFDLKKAEQEMEENLYNMHLGWKENIQHTQFKSGPYPVFKKLSEEKEHMVHEKECENQNEKEYKKHIDYEKHKELEKEKHKEQGKLKEQDKQKEQETLKEQGKFNEPEKLKETDKLICAEKLKGTEKPKESEIHKAQHEKPTLEQKPEFSSDIKIEFASDNKIERNILPILDYLCDLLQKIIERYRTHWQSDRELESECSLRQSKEEKSEYVNQILKNIEQEKIQWLQTEFANLLEKICFIATKNLEDCDSILKNIEAVLLNHKVRGNSILCEVAPYRELQVEVNYDDSLADRNTFALPKYMEDVLNNRKDEIEGIHITIIDPPLNIPTRAMRHSDDLYMEEMSALGKPMPFDNQKAFQAKCKTLRNSYHLIPTIMSVVESDSENSDQAEKGKEDQHYSKSRTFLNKSSKFVDRHLPPGQMDEYSSKFFSQLRYYDSQNGSSRWSPLLNSLEGNKDYQQFLGGTVKISSQNKRHTYVISTGGNFTPVELGLDNYNRPLAVKRIPSGSCVCNLIKQLVTPLLTLRNTNLLHYSACDFDNNEMIIATPLCEYNMGQYVMLVKQNNELPFNATDIIKQVLTGLMFLHTQKDAIVHGNLKPSNIFIDSNNVVRVAEFGTHKALFKLKEAPNSSIIWFSTETFKAFKHHSKMECTLASDVQVAGMLIHFIITAGTHVYGDDTREILRNLEKAAPKFSSSDLELQDLLTWMLMFFPTDRPTIHQVCSHVYFWSTDKKWEFVLACAGLSVHGKDIPINRDNFYYTIDKAAFKDNIKGKWAQVVRSKSANTITKVEENDDTPSGLLKFIRASVKAVPSDDFRNDLECCNFFLNNFPAFTLSLYRIIDNTEWMEHRAFVNFYAVHSEVF